MGGRLLPRGLDKVCARGILIPRRGLVENFSSAFAVPRSERAKVSRRTLGEYEKLRMLTISRVTNSYMVYDQGNERIFIANRTRCSHSALTGRCFESGGGKLGPGIPCGCFPGSSTSGAPPVV